MKGGRGRKEGESKEEERVGGGEKKGKAVRDGGNDGNSMRKVYYFMIASLYFGKFKRILHTQI